MRVKLFQILIPALSFSLIACSSAARGDSATPRVLPPYSHSSVADEPPLPLEYWDGAGADISEIDERRKLIAFTFDDTPARTVENILAVFAAYNEDNPDCKAFATLFCNGIRFDEQTATLLHAACALGFELGNHAHTHADLTTLSAENVREEIAKTDGLLRQIDGQPFHLLRAPFGKVNETVRAQAKTPIIDWTIDTLDWTKRPAEEIYNAVMEGKFSGAIVLMHDGYPHTVSALKRLLPDLKREGYQVVGVSQMIKAHRRSFSRGGVYIRVRKG